MIIVEELYADSDFTDMLVRISAKNLLDFDDFRQSVFLEIIESGCKTLHECKQAAWRVRHRIQKDNIKHQAYSIDEEWDAASDEEYPSVLWEDRHVLAI